MQPGMRIRLVAFIQLLYGESVHRERVTGQLRCFASFPFFENRFSLRFIQITNLNDYVLEIGERRYFFYVRAVLILQGNVTRIMLDEQAFND